MPKLPSKRQEKYCRLRAMGNSPGDAYQGSGYEAKTWKLGQSYAWKLGRRPEIKARILEIQEELREDGVVESGVDRGWVLSQLKEIHQKAAAEEEVLDRQGNPTGEFRFQGGVANRSLELIGKELGMFADRLILDDMDNMLEGFTHQELTNYVKGIATSVGLRVVDDDEEIARDWIFKNCTRLGLRVEDCRQDPDGTQDAPGERVQPESEAGRVSRTRPH